MSKTYLKSDHFNGGGSLTINGNAYMSMNGCDPDLIKNSMIPVPVLVE